MLDAANILKPALARGAIRVIGATTIKEYRQTIEKDGALERRHTEHGALLGGKITAGQTIRVEVRDGWIQFCRVSPP